MGENIIWKYIRRYIMYANPLFLKLQDKLDTINTIIHEDISGIRIIKAGVRESMKKRDLEKQMKI